MTVSQTILDAWDKNAQAWVKTVRENILASRRLVTNAAIVEQLSSESDLFELFAQLALDVDCVCYPTYPDSDQIASVIFVLKTPPTPTLVHRPLG